MNDASALHRNEPLNVCGRTKSLAGAEGLRVRNGSTSPECCSSVDRGGERGWKLIREKLTLQSAQWRFSCCPCVKMLPQCPSLVDHPYRVSLWVIHVCGGFYRVTTKASRSPAKTIQQSSGQNIAPPAIRSNSKRKGKQSLKKSWKILFHKLIK